VQVTHVKKTVVCMPLPYGGAQRTMLKASKFCKTKMLVGHVIDSRSSRTKSREPLILSMRDSQIYKRCIEHRKDSKQIDTKFFQSNTSLA
jgi:hypothetical protein